MFSGACHGELFLECRGKIQKCDPETDYMRLLIHYYGEHSAHSGAIIQQVQIAAYAWNLIDVYAGNLIAVCAWIDFAAESTDETKSNSRFGNFNYSKSGKFLLVMEQKRFYHKRNEKDKSETGQKRKRTKGRKTC